MTWSEITDNPAFEDVRRTAVLEALSRDDFTPRWPEDDSSADLSAMHAGGTAVGRFGYAPDICEFSTGSVVANVDSSTVDSSSRLVGRIIAAEKHEDIIAALVLLGLSQIAHRLRYLHELAKDDEPDEPSIALASLRRMALFFVSKPGLLDPEIGLSPDGLLQAEWRLEDGSILAMKFLSVDLIRFAAVSNARSYGQRRRVDGTLTKNEVLAAVRGFVTRGAP